MQVCYIKTQITQILCILQFPLSCIQIKYTYTYIHFIQYKCIIQRMEYWKFVQYNSSSFTWYKYMNIDNINSCKWKNNPFRNRIMSKSLYINHYKMKSNDGNSTIHIIFKSLRNKRIKKQISFAIVSIWTHTPDSDNPSWEFI